MTWENTPAKVITLEKVVDGAGLPKGHIFFYTYKAASDSEAIARARRALLRDHSGENALNWSVVR